MTARRSASSKMILGVVLSLGILGLSAADETTGYTSVAPPGATLTALRAQVLLVQNWLDDKDFASAAQSAQGLIVLADIVQHQGGDADWQKRNAELRARCNSVLETVKKKDVAGSANLLKQCLAQLDDLAKNGPTGKKAAVSAFKPRGGTKDWMLLLEGAYVDAKSARTPKDLELLGQAIAEEVHAVGYLRADPRWRSSAQEVRDQALKAAALAQNNKMDEAKKELKGVYQRCEVCHGRYQK